MIFSMTAFARCEKKYTWGSIAWEIRSLNKRYLDVYIDIPKHLHGFSDEIRRKVNDCCIRGRIECYLFFEVNHGVGSSEFEINEKLLFRLIEVVKWIKLQVNTGEIDPLLILSWPGVVTYTKDNITDVNLRVLQCFEETLHSLVIDREREGLFLRNCIIDRLHCMSKEVQKIRQCIPNVLDLKRKKLLNQMESICVVNTVRLEQELLIMIQKMDISEEIDRLIGHIEAAHALILEKKRPMGRKLDFMAQELYREINTISAKSINFDITQSAISLKVFVEQFREQVQNIE